MKALEAFLTLISAKFFLNGGWDAHSRGWSLWGYLMSLVKHRHTAKQTTEINLVSFYKKLSHLIRAMFYRFPRVVITKCHRNLFYHFSALQIIQDTPIPGLLGCSHSSLLYPAVCWASLQLTLGTLLIISFSVLEVKLMLLVPCTFFKERFYYV